jgi:hypothetical protein
MNCGRVKFCDPEQLDNVAMFESNILVDLLQSFRANLLHGDKNGLQTAI